MRSDYSCTDCNIYIGNVKITSEDIKDTEMIDNADYIAPVSETEITDDGKINHTVAGAGTGSMP